MPLNEQDRQKLDGIVSKMESNGEKSEDIQFVVNDFKSKYEQPTASPTTIGEMRRREEQPGFGQPIPQSEEPDQGPAQIGQPFPLANRPQSPVGSIDQLNLAVEQSSRIGGSGPTDFNFDQNETPVDYNVPKFQNEEFKKAALILGPESAAKLQARREQQYGSMPPAGPGQYVFSRPAPESDLLPEEAAYLSKERSQRESQYAGTAVRYGTVPIVGAVTAGLGLGPLATYASLEAANVASEAGAEMLQDGKLNYGNILGSAANVPSYGRISSGSANPVRKGIESALNIFNEEISGSKFKTFLKSGLKGATESGVQASIENSLSDAQNQQSVLERTVGGGLVNPLLGGLFKGAGAAYRNFAGDDASFNNFIGELNRPFVQQTLKARSKKFTDDFKLTSGIDPKYADELARMLYSPEIHTTPEKINQFKERLRGFIIDSVITGKRTGLETGDLAGEIADALSKTVKNVDAEGKLLIESIVRDLDTTYNSLQDSIDNRLKNDPEIKDLIDKAREFEGRKSTDILNEDKIIADLESKKAGLSSDNTDELKKLNDEIFNAETRKLKYEQKNLGFKSRENKSEYKTGLRIKELINQEYEKFKKIQNKKYGDLKNKWANISVTIDKVDPDGNPVFVKDKVTNKPTDVVETETFTFDQIKQKRTDILAGFNFESTIQQGTFPQYEQLKKQNDLIDEALEEYPDIFAAFKTQNASFAKGIKRFQPKDIQKLIRDQGWAGGVPETITKITGPTGTTYLKELENALGDSWFKGKSDISNYIYNYLIDKSKNPTEFVEQLLSSRIKVNDPTLSREIVNKFFPYVNLKSYQLVAQKYESEITTIVDLNKKISDSNIAFKALTQDVENKIVGSKAKQDVIKQDIVNYNEKLKKTQDEIELKLKKTPDEGVILKEIERLKTSISEGKGSYLFKDNEIDFIQRNSGDTPELFNNLSKYLEFKNSEAVDFSKRIKEEIKGGGKFEGSEFTPSLMVDHIMSVNKLDGRRIMNTMTPELQEDVKALFTSKLLQEVTDGKKIDTKKLRTLISENTKGNDFYETAQLLLGQKGVDQLNTIAKQLETFEPDNKIADSIWLSLSSVMAYAVSRSYGSLTGAAAGVGAWAARRQIFDTAATVKASAIKKALSNPDYIKAASTPIDQLTSEQIKKYENYIPRLMKLAYDKWQIADDFKSEEKQLQETQRQTRRRD